VTRAVFLDRDGTLNVETGYVHRAEEWEWVPGAIEALRLLNAAGYLAIVVTNQAGIARGLYAEADVAALHAHVAADAQKHGARIDAFYHCPHHPQFGAVRECGCRKPAPGLLLRAQRDFAIDLARSFMIGDKPGDIAAGRAAGVTPLLVETGYGREARAEVGADVPVFPDVLAAVRFATL
jgi:D-glycero-D-manno-heptose 1,7-bisphosphate phosphatase